MQRAKFKDKIERMLKVLPVVALVGPRQVGKTTLAKEWAAGMAGKGLFLDLQNPVDLARLDAPSLTLSAGLAFVVLDEIQLKPELFPFLRTFVDATQRKVPILLLGSASRDLIRQGAESLAGRIGFVEITPFTLEEAGNSPRRLLRGGYPLSFLADDEQNSLLWRREYIRTFLERDVPALGFDIPPLAMRRLWEMLAHVHGNILNLSELGRSLGASDHAVRRYVDILVGTFVVRALQPWHENISKRQVRAPKIYIRDTGLLHSLLRIEDAESLASHPKAGASWEGYALEGVLAHFDWPAEDVFFWGTHSGAELDLLALSGGKRLGFEFKVSDAPKITRSMRSAMESLKLDSLTLVIPGEATSFALEDRVRVTTLDRLSDEGSK